MKKGFILLYQKTISSIKKKTVTSDDCEVVVQMHEFEFVRLVWQLMGKDSFIIAFVISKKKENFYEVNGSHEYYAKELI